MMHKSPPFIPLLLSFFSSALIAAPAVFLSWWALGFRSRHLPLDLPVKVTSLIDLGVGGFAFALIALPGIWMAGEQGLREYMLKIFNRLSPFKLK
jgi:hypothetical protein